MAGGSRMRKPDWLHYYTLNLMKEAGANWVRWGQLRGADRRKFKAVMNLV